MNAPRETEIKLPISDLTETRKQVESLGWKIHKERYFEDNFLLDTADHALQQNKTLLRVRMIGPTPVAASSEGLLTFKGRSRVSEGVKDREEIECELETPERLIEILAKLGFLASFRYQKYRTTFRIENVPMEICIDETPIGNYFELEGEIPAIHEWASRLGFSRDQYMTESYAALYFRWCRENEIEPSHMIFS